jgi:ABC-2 type transport system ATP-binding protein
MIKVESVEKSYGPLKAVDGISFEIARGETFGLLGPNGAGKTTTISMLIGILNPDAGTVAITDIGNPADPRTRRAIGIAPQSLSLYEELTARENLKFFAQLYEYSGQQLRERIDWAFEFSGLADRQRDRVSTFSGGMKRRLNMACALIHEPKILLMDEPTVGVDPQSRNHIFDRIEELKQAGCTIIYTTHYMEEAERLCDRVGIIDHGKLLAVDSIDALIDSRGGRSVVLAELEQIPDGVELPGSLEETALRFESDEPLREVGRLSDAGVRFQTLQVTRPDLESVFLSLTGRSLRDD